MHLSQISLLACTLALVIASVQPTSGFAADTEAPATNKAETVKKLVCEKPVKQRGPGNLIESVAELQTIIAWSKTVTVRFNDNWAHWHNAKAKRVKCTRTGASQYYYCELSASPCADQQDIVPPDQTQAGVKAQAKPPSKVDFIEDAPYIKNGTPADQKPVKARSAQR